MRCIVFAPNITLGIQNKNVIALPHFLQYYFKGLVAKTINVLEYLYSVRASFFLLNLVSIVEKLKCCWSILSFLLSQPLHSLTVLKSPLASWWNPSAVSFLSSNWVRKDACIFAVTGRIYTPSKVYLITSPCSKGYSISATNRCPSLLVIGKPPWSLWLNVFEIHCSTEGPYR
jgi:hypothetical protein